jgi:thiosulfate/3-mercaptopyruvate sulfurtransferase
VFSFFFSEDCSVSFLHHLVKILALIVLSGLLFSCSRPGESTSPVDTAEAEMDSLVSAEWLREHLGDPDLVLLDSSVLVEPDDEGGLRMVNGRANYDAGHIPTAGFADLMGELSKGDSPLEFAMPTPEQFLAAMSALGVSDDSRVVVYDSMNMAWAARVWWMLRWIGFDRAALLDGGLGAWTTAGYPLSTEPASRPAGHLTLSLRPELIADRDEVFAALEDSTVMLLDAMSLAHYRGEWAMYDRPGHISGASNLPSSLLMDEAGRFRPHDELEMLIDGDRNARTITYCGGGIAAAADAFVLNRLGFTDVAIYAASLQEWAADPANPMEIGDEPAR